VSTNTYFVPEKKDVTKPSATTWLNTPTVEYADLTALARLPAASIKVSATKSREGAQGRVAVTLENVGSGIALLVRGLVRRGVDGPPVAPVFWDDNFVTLRPGATRVLTVTFPETALGGHEASVEIEGMNVARISAP
jgi:exo-1,4-beta-D-glucosaminidase